MYTKNVSLVVFDLEAVATSQYFYTMWSSKIFLCRCLNNEALAVQLKMGLKLM